MMLSFAALRKNVWFAFFYANPNRAKFRSFVSCREVQQKNLDETDKQVHFPLRETRQQRFLFNIIVIVWVFIA